jgi:transposase-like protein
MSTKRDLWIKRMQAWERSGQTRAAFCRARGVNRHTFDYWRRLLREASGALVPVVVDDMVSAAIQIALPNGVRLQIAVGTDAAQVGKLVAVLRSC